MAREQFRSYRWTADHMARIATINQIIATYQAEGYSLTLRQLYYQHVARGLIANNDEEYKRLGELLNKARLGGLVDWAAIVDRTRNVEQNPHWDSPAGILDAVAEQFRYDTRDDQPNYIEVWVEKDALVGVLEQVCRRLDVPYYSCRGYSSQTGLYDAGKRLLRAERSGKIPHIVHLGDHDPSGIDMTRDIDERLEMFVGQPVEVHRIALNYDQVQEFNPPPNPAKMTDSRASGYVERFGRTSWELDALDDLTDLDLLAEQIERQRVARAQLRKLSDEWDTISADLEVDPD
jgi:hypothetical protein